MSNLKNLITLACFLMGANFAFGQTLTITDAAPSGEFSPNSTEEVTITITGASISDPVCTGTWDLDIVTTSNYEDFTGEILDLTLEVDGTGTGSIMVDLATPPTGNLTINVVASKTGCNAPNEVMTLDVAAAAGQVCGTAFLEDFEGVPVNTGLTNNTSSQATVGQGTAFRNGASLGGNSYFRVQNQNSSKQLVARNVGGTEVYWVSNDIIVEECCPRDISVDIFGEAGDATGTVDYVRVYYQIDGGAEQLLGEGLGAFTSTVSANTQDLMGIGESNILNLVVRVRNDASNEYHGFDNVSVTQGTLVEAPQLLTITCNAEGGGSTAIVSAESSSMSTISYQFNGGTAGPNNEINVPIGSTNTIVLSNTDFPNCGTTEGSFTINSDGTCDILLPIALLDFYGRAEADAIGLYWSTTTEIDNDYIAVERSLNGVDFEEIGRVEGNGTTTEKQNYTYVDNYPVSGTNYYRLRQVDYDGAAEYHPVISVLFDRPLEFRVKVSPNPARETLWVDWTLPEKQDGVLRVYDMQGQLMSQRAIAQGSGRYNLPIGDLPAGMYVLQMEQGGNLETLRFVKK
ncbi:T9SS type A sorting domain-containing protein [Flavilitoribacter nigricans]|uniref:Secretion system C-terminal sorting domain-containing protein n=1 Tax=Flavilitoribacter nigricans (strain ATCC 23147 / DSM 23189 / NBRC 102662 / NCIMB 1420 / SS-2) TaxID=1122177 RepID=A0A2D0N577_FLAN2|nr:T9SS type A sorting domain-containing protein [Flavilitoribacter nigricans]PHN03655.1 hypothetical protein CRP01_25735 [Flavilitoribacter nigricans DSM 23189 = NBRC 102662]